MGKLLVIADDLTGALDTAVQFAKHGIATLVLPDVPASTAEFDAEVLVIDTETRHSDAAPAAEAVRRAVEFGKRKGVQHVYKKTDSTLRGNLGAELEALLAASGASRVMFVPAFPRMQRVTRGGRHYVGGVELHKSEFARDPLDPITTSDVAAIIRRQTATPVHAMSCDRLCSAGAFNEKGVYVFDCASDEDLRAIAGALRRKGMLHTLAGSAGLAEHLTEFLEFRTRIPVGLAGVPQRMLVVSGSLNPVAQRQVEAAVRSGFSAVNLDPALLIAGPRESSAALTRLLAEVRAHEMEAGSLVLCAPANALKVEELAQAAGLGGRDVFFRVAENLGQLVAAVLANSSYRLLTVFGGDTLASIVRALGCRAIVPRAEIVRGIALSEIRAPGRELFVISKAGGFGGEDVLARVQESLRRFQ